MEPWFTFEARVPPHELHRLTVRQIHAHLTWWEANRGQLDITVTTKDRG